MDFFGANSEGEWSSLSGTYTAEEADFMAQLLGSCSFPSNQPDVFRAQSVLDESFSFDSNELLHVSESDHNKENFYFDASNSSIMPMELCIGDYINKETVLDENPRKRARESSDHHVEAKKRNVKAKTAKKTQKMAQSASNDEYGSAVSSSCSDGNDNNGGLSSGLTLSSKGKVRASRGSATDPQSLYARKRRERINERLRILQSLVPNGTKVDISTMLEEAVEYVKFLQLQIKLLSSDDMWMYSPIAYNGMDLGLNITIPETRTA